MEHSGVYHHYYNSRKTTHIIASNLPDVKVRQLKGHELIVKVGKLTTSCRYIPSVPDPHNHFCNFIDLDLGCRAQNVGTGTVPTHTARKVTRNIESES